MHPPSALYLRLPNWIGDVCMSLPSLDLLLDTGLPVVACARPWAQQLLAAYDLAGFVPMTGRWRQDRAAVAGHRKQARHLHARGLLLPDSLSSAMVFKFAGLPSAGYRDDGRSLLLRWPLDKPVPAPHAVRYWFELSARALSGWKLPVAPAAVPSTLGLEVTPQHETQALDALHQAGLEAGNFVLIAPTATGRHHGKDKVWPHFDTLTRALQQQGLTVAMCPPPAEREAALHNAPTALLLPPLNLASFATLARSAALVVCNDSGVSHLAAAVNACQLTLFGVTDAHRTGPWSPRAERLGSSTGWPAPDEVLSRSLALITKSGTR